MKTDSRLKTTQAIGSSLQQAAGMKAGDCRFNEYDDYLPLLPTSGLKY